MLFVVVAVFVGAITVCGFFAYALWLASDPNMSAADKAELYRRAYRA